MNWPALLMLDHNTPCTQYLPPPPSPPFFSKWMQACDYWEEGGCPSWVCTVLAHNKLIFSLLKRMRSYGVYVRNMWALNYKKNGLEPVARNIYAEHQRGCCICLLVAHDTKWNSQSTTWCCAWAAWWKAKYGLKPRSMRMCVSLQMW